MIFVISYDRGTGTSTWLAEYPDSEMEAAQQRRLTAEIEARIAHRSPEIVVLTADSKSDLLKTHAKYFGREALERTLRNLLEHPREKAG